LLISISNKNLQEEMLR